MTVTPRQLRAQVLDDARASEAIAPRCRHAPPGDFCGGCTLQDRAYAAQVAAKHAALRRLWAGLLPNLPESIGFVPSPDPFEYRTRMDFVASRGRFGLRRGGKFNYIIDLAECHLIPLAGFTAARAVYERAMELGLPDYDLRSHEGFLRYITVRRSPDDEFLLVAVTAGADRREAMAELAVCALAQERVVGFHWLHNPAVTDLASGAALGHWGAATLAMRVGNRRLQIGPGTFFQNNVHLLVPLLDDIAACVIDPQIGPTPRDCTVVDLYGGVGTVALHLAEQVGQLFCVEAVAESVALARDNVAENGVGNIAVVAADVAEFLRLTDGRFDVMVADPPRNGLGPAVCAELLRLQPARIVYVSCNPITQVDDARTLLDRYRLRALRGYDMFPQTPHLETLAVFELA